MELESICTTRIIAGCSIIVLGFIACVQGVLMAVTAMNTGYFPPDIGLVVSLLTLVALAGHGILSVWIITEL